MARIEMRVAGESQKLLHTVVNILGSEDWAYNADQWDCEAIWPNSHDRGGRLRGFIQWVQIQVLHSVQ